MKKDEVFFEYPNFTNVKQIMLESISKNGECRAFIIKEKDGSYTNITYKELLNEINSFGTGLFNLGLKNKRVAIIGKNDYMWCLSYLTVLMGGMIAVPIDKGLEEAELESSLIRSKAEAVIFDEKHIDAIKNIRANGKTNIKEYITNAKDTEFKSYEDIKLKGKEIFEKGNKDFENAEIDDEKMSILLFTSGTTSQSKAVMLSQKNIASNICSMRLVEEFKNTDVNLQFLPLHHTFGSTALLVMLSAGVATAFPDGLRYIAQNLKEYKVSIFVGVPLLVESIYKKVEQGIEKKGKTKVINIAKKVTNVLDVCNIKLKRKIFKQVIDELGGDLRMIISGAAPLDKKVSKGFNELGVRLLQGYGLTETAPVLAAENYKYIKYGSVGFPMPNVQIEIVDKDDKGIGELRAKGPNVMLGYYENEQATNAVLKDGWFYTGDYGYIDPEGFVFITGRKKNMIVLKNGKKIFPEEVEELVNKIDLVKESMVFGLPKGDDLLLSVKVQYDEELAKEKYPDKSAQELEKIVWNKIKKEVNKTLPTYKYIKHMVFTNEDFIKTTTAKIKRYEEINKIIAQQK